MTVVTCLVIDGHDYVTIWSSTGRRCVKLALCGQVKMQTRFGPRVVAAFHAWSKTQNVVCRARVYTWSATMLFSTSPETTDEPLSVPRYSKAVSLDNAGSNPRYWPCVYFALFRTGSARRTPGGLRGAAGRPAGVPITFFRCAVFNMRAHSTPSRLAHSVCLGFLI